MITFSKKAAINQLFFLLCQLYQTGDGLVTQKNEISSWRKPLSWCIWFDASNAPTRHHWCYL